MTDNHEAQPPRTSRKVKLAAAVAAAAAVAGSAFAFAGNASAGEEHQGGGKKAKPSAAGGFAPYVDTSLQPSFDLLKSSEKTGVKEFNLAFITSGGGCTPKWGGTEDIGSNAVAKQIEDFRAKGGDVRVSFGGAAGSELGLACGSADELAEAYGKVIEAFALKKADFDIEGAALPDTEANTRRAQAIAQLQKKHKDLDVSFTLPVLPEGLTQDGTGLLENAKKNGVKVSAVNIMAMDYGPSYDGDMGKYAIDAATATQKQIKSALGIDDDAEAWKTVAVTPMIGVNDVNVEIFKPDDAVEVKKFADEKNLGWLSMWSATRDKACPGGPKDQADPTCSSIEQGADDFAEAFTG
ncbi:chitinase [Streptomyces sp. WMMB 322]|uniref:chitinase n=1 Tax=Streptomyces sp. WMMB 322 TaxID=1286821 RepID=UPI0006E2D274|nr:chitinase [Streptomyces sp. WMMB 322]